MQTLASEEVSRVASSFKTEAQKSQSDIISTTFCWSKQVASPRLTGRRYRPPTFCYAGWHVHTVMGGVVGGQIQSLSTILTFMCALAKRNSDFFTIMYHPQIQRRLSVKSTKCAGGICENSKQQVERNVKIKRRNSPGTWVLCLLTVQVPIWAPLWDMPTAPGIMALLLKIPLCIEPKLNSDRHLWIEKWPGRQPMRQQKNRNPKCHDNGVSRARWS